MRSISDTGQIPLELDHRPQLDRESFIVSPSNKAALELIESWPAWPTPTIILFGPEGAGKSHLVSIAREISAGVAADLKNKADLPTSTCLFVEDIDRGAIDEGRRLAEAGGDDLAPGEWHGTNLATASPEELEGVLADTVLKEFKTRLGRIGLEYQSPAAP